MIIGVGNSLRSDDGVGPVVIAHLATRIEDSVILLEHQSDGISLMERWQDADTVIVVDAASSEAPCGTIHRFDVAESELPRGFFHASTHELGVAEAVEMARLLRRLPQRLIVYAIEGENFAAGTDMTPAVANAVESVATQILEELSRVRKA